MRTWTLTALTALAIALGAPVTASAAFIHVISPGESLYSVAAADGLTVGQLAAANGLSPDAQLTSGSTIAIPPQTAGVTPAAPSVATPVVAASPSSEAEPDGDADDAATGAPAVTASPGGGYLVQPGDTLSAIAARYGVSMQQLAAINGIDPAGVLRYGTRISISGAPVAPASSAGSAAAPVAATPVVSSGTVQPTQEFVSPSTVGSIAAQNGVPASLAEAIGYQESGFNNGMVSSTGATGVMQIEPGTWNYIGANLAGPPPLSPASATDNIRAGTLYLRSLLNETGGDPAMAAAAYYQGLQSVRQHGLYADTQQYVNNVMALRARFGGP